MHTGRVIAAACVIAAASLSLTPATAAFADTPAEIRARLGDARSRRDSLYEEAEAASERLNAAQGELDATDAAIAAKEGEIAAGEARVAEARASLARRLGGDYKGRGSAVAAALSGITDIGGLTQALDAIGRVTSASAGDIERVEGMCRGLEADRAELAGRRAEQERLRDELASGKEELDARVSEADAYVSGLSADLKRAVAEEDARAAAAAAPSGPIADAGDVSAARRAIIAYAESMVGGTYRYGASSFRYTDCSGLTMQCYAQVGVSLGHSSEIQRRFCDKPVSQAVPGDIMYRPGHVGIYIGNGVTVEAFNPSRGIGYGSASRFVSCGSPLG